MRVLVGLLLVTGIAAAHPADDFMNAFADAWVRADPERATRYDYFEGAEQARLDGQLTPVTQAYQLERLARVKQALSDLAEIDLSDADQNTRRAVRMFTWQLEDQVKAAEFTDYHFPLTAYNGPQRRKVSWLANSHPLRNLQDAKNYVSRVGQFGGLIDDTVAEMERREERGFLLPDFIIRSTIEQMEGFIATTPAENLFATSLNRRLARVDEVPESTRQQLVAEIESILVESLYPSYERAIAMLRRQLPQANSDAGLWRLEGGDAAYADRLRHYTNSDMTAQEVHDLGLSEVARIETRMDEILREFGLTEGSVTYRYGELEMRIQPRGPNARQELLDEYLEMVRKGEELSRPLFDELPEADVVVRREPLFSERNASARYTLPAVDGSEPGVFWVPLPGEPFRMISRRSLAYHEAVPGHHFQLAWMQETASLPRWWKHRMFGGNSANTEGWALYAEWLANDEGWYEDDLIGELGFLFADLKRARRLVVDTGLHAFGWTRQQVIDYGMGPAETDRYIVWPGQACSYKIGQLLIIKLRHDAEARLGDKFSLPKFHNVMLRNAASPLDMVADEIEAWVQSQLDS